ncbi:MAG: class I SAM-dependent methyltransferase [Leptospiraceae bacterium]|nr:class I SAM-dependent methyltransferase [Leptospiraceae bacterium]
MSNIHYKSEKLLQFYSKHRNSWDSLYPSERWVFDRVVRELEQNNVLHILDVGAACGGLYSALKERIDQFDYVGLDINEAMIEWAKQNHDSPNAKFECLDAAALAETQFPSNLVVSLSCADWNVETHSILDACWKQLRPGGQLVISLRLTNLESINDIERSYQYIDAIDGSDVESRGEKANYVVLNWRDSLQMLADLNGAETILQYGYWGAPSSSAVTEFERLCFTVCAVRKSVDEDFRGSPRCELHLPQDLFDSPSTARN